MKGKLVFAVSRITSYLLDLSNIRLMCTKGPETPLLSSLNSLKYKGSMQIFRTQKTLRKASK